MYKYCVDANIIIRYFLSQSNECKDKINLLAYNSEFYIFDKTIIEVCDVLFGKKYFCKTKEN
ncbi:hypothetical protein FACS189459_6010 [Bacilli bacterium]|nr:hypothetical protein FACS189459_6010 [Bacilli bacterium]